MLLISSELHQKITTVKEIKKVSLNKIRVTFGNREDANAVVELYRVYIPSGLVEINGVIYDESIDPIEIEEHGVGKFKNNLVPSVTILECERLVMREKVGENEEYIPSRVLRVTFSGTILPDLYASARCYFTWGISVRSVAICKERNIFSVEDLITQ